MWSHPGHQSLYVDSACTAGHLGNLGPLGNLTALLDVPAGDLMCDYGIDATDVAAAGPCNTVAGALNAGLGGSAFS